MGYNNNKYDREITNNWQRGGDSSQCNSSSTHNPGSEAVQAQPLEVKVYDNAFDRALRAFKSLVQKERILSIYKEKQRYEKPSVKRRRKRNEAIRKLMEDEVDIKPRRRNKDKEKQEKTKE
jgi:small subunit ribosomal protein S21